MKKTDYNFLNNKVILLTGGTGSFGKNFVYRLVKKNCSPKKLIIFSRDEQKQFFLKEKLKSLKLNKDYIRFFIGDIRDLGRLDLAFKDVDFLINSAAMKHISSSEYNPFECVKTNILGSQNIISSAINNNIKKVISISTDKAVNPCNLYGATKLVSEKLFVNANFYCKSDESRFAVVRYGNVVGSRGSVIPIFQDCVVKKKDIPITDEKMTRFWISLNQAVDFVISSLKEMSGGEIFIPKIPSMKVTDIAKAIAPDLKQKYIGMQPGEKLAECLISSDESNITYELNDRFLIINNDLKKKISQAKQWKKVKTGFNYSSDTNKLWLSNSDIHDLISEDNAKKNL